MQQHIDTHAYQTEHGVQAQCQTPGPSFGVTYIATEFKITDNSVCWTICGVCDALMNTFEDRNPALPQWHPHEWGTQS